MNWEFIGKYLPMYEKAALLTVKIGVIGILFAILLGLVCAAIQYYKVPVLRWIVAVYVELSRNTPLLVQLFFIYYGFPKIGIRMSAEVCGVVGLAFLGGSYMAEAFRSGLEAVEPIQNESAISLGMNSGQVLRYVILPQAMSTSIPAFVANIIFLLKETSVFSAISLMDLMFTAKDLIGLYYKTTESLFLLVVFYLLILLPVSIVGSLVERRMRYAGFGDFGSLLFSMVLHLQQHHQGENLKRFFQALSQNLFRSWIPIHDYSCTSPPNILRSCFFKRYSFPSTDLSVIPSSEAIWAVDCK